MNKDLIKRLNKLGLTADYEPNEYLNIARKDGLNCEFYGCGPDDAVFTASYTINGEMVDLDICVDNEDGVVEFIDVVKQILEIA